MPSHIICYISALSSSHVLVLSACETRFPREIIYSIKIEVMIFFMCDFFNLDHSLEILLNAFY